MLLRLYTNMIVFVGLCTMVLGILTYALFVRGWMWWDRWCK